MSSVLILDAIDTQAIVHQWLIQAAYEGEVQRRASNRMPFLRPATLCLDASDTSVMCRDISEQGIGIVQSSGRLPRGECAVVLSLRNQTLNFDVTFKHAKIMDNGWSMSGGNFNLASIDPASLVALKLSSLVERRIRRRHPFCHAFFVYRDLDLSEQCIGVENIPAEKEAHAVSLDISPFGMRFVTKAFEFNHEFIYLRKQGTPTMFRGRIVSRRHHGNGHAVIGVKFATF